MLDTATSPTPEVQAATPATQEPAGSNGTATSNGSDANRQAGAAPSEDTFLSGDPSKLPPEVRQHYDNMLKDYKQKTQAIAEERKRLPELEKKAKSYDQITSDQQIKDYLAGLSRGERAQFKEQKAQAEKRLGEKISDEKFAKAFESKEGFLGMLEEAIQDGRAKDQQEIAELKQKVGLNETADAIESVASEIDKSSKQPLRPDFYDLDEDKLITGYLQVNRPKNSQEVRTMTVQAYEWAKAIKAKYTEMGRAEALKVIQAKAQNSSEPPTVTSKGAYSGPDPKKVDVSEAVALARKGIRVPHN